MPVHRTQREVDEAGLVRQSLDVTNRRCSLPDGGGSRPDATGAQKADVNIFRYCGFVIQPLENSETISRVTLKGQAT